MTNTALIELLIEHGLTADRLETDVEAILMRRDLSLKQATTLYRAVTEAEGAYRRTVQQLASEGAIDKDVHDLINNLDGLWDELSSICANRLREIQGIDSIDPDQRL